MTDTPTWSDQRPPARRQNPPGRPAATVTGPVQRGDRRGRQIGFRTLNLAAPTDAVGDGVWAGWVRVGEGDRGITLAAAVSIGTRATFYSDGGERLVEAHLPACFGDLYGRTVTVAMCTHLRGQRAFGTVDELVAQLRRDVDATLEWWRAATSDPTNPNPGAHMNITILVGNPKPQSRTRQVAETLVEHLLDDSRTSVTVVDLADHIDEVFDWQAAHMNELTDQVAASDLVVVASPTYKATYTGLLKAFLDRFPQNGLNGVVAIPVMTGADDVHSMGPDVNLAPLLVELGAVVPGRGFYFVTGAMDRLDELAAAAAGEYARNLGSLARVAQHTRPID